MTLSASPFEKPAPAEQSGSHLFAASISPLTLRPRFGLSATLVAFEQLPNRPPALRAISPKSPFLMAGLRFFSLVIT
jgi:hypothetical protein